MSLQISNLNEILDKAEPLAGMGIIISEISRDGDTAVYVAQIPEKSPGKGYVTPHFHPILDGGTEWYQIIEAGEDAFMHTGKPIKKDTGYEVDWDKPSPIKPGDFFIVPNGIVHSLVSGTKRLRFLFGCPDSHLDNDVDKIVLDGVLPPRY